MSQQQTASDTILILEESDVLTVSDEAEYDAQWSFTAPIEEEGEESQSLSRHAKRPRVGTVVPGNTAGKKATRLPN